MNRHLKNTSKAHQKHSIQHLKSNELTLQNISTYCSCKPMATSHKTHEQACHGHCEKTSFTCSTDILCRCCPRKTTTATFLARTFRLGLNGTVRDKKMGKKTVTNQLYVICATSCLRARLWACGSSLVVSDGKIRPHFENPCPYRVESCIFLMHVCGRVPRGTHAPVWNRTYS